MGAKQESPTLDNAKVGDYRFEQNLNIVPCIIRVPLKVIFFLNMNILEFTTNLFKN